MLNFLFGFLLDFPAPVAVLIYAVFVLILINLAYKFLMDQEKVSELKQKSKDLGKKMKEAQKKGNTKESKQLMGKMMKYNQKTMKYTMKPMIVSLVVVVLLLPWLRGNYGDHFVGLNDTNVTINDKLYSIEVGRDTFNINDFSCQMPCRDSFADGYWNVKREKGKVKLERIVALLPAGISLPLFGDDLGWLAWYFILSLPLMVVIRKGMGIKI